MKIIDRAKLNELQSQESPSIPKHLAEAIEIILFAEEGRGLLFKDHILEIQNTTRENYPAILNAFIADVNKSTNLIMKAIATLHENNLLNITPQVYGHAIKINDKNDIISVDAEKAFGDFFEETKKHINTLCRYSLHRTWITGLSMDELKKFKSVVESRSDRFKMDMEMPAWCHPTFFTIDLIKGINALKTIIHEGDSEAEECFNFFLNPEYNHPFNPLYYSCNLVDFRIIPKKSVVYPIGDMEFVAQSAGGLKKGGKEVYPRWEPTFSIEFYIKKFLVEEMTGKSFKIFISAARDYLARDYFKLSQDRNWHEEHPFVMQSRVVLEFEERIEQVKEAYEAAISILRKHIGNEIFIDTASLQSEMRSLGHKEPTFTASDSFTAEECFEYINQWAKEKISKIVKDFGGNDKFRIAKAEEIYIQEAIDSVLTVYYREDNGQGEGGIIQAYRDRATFHTTMIDSLVFDYRQGAVVRHSKAAQEAIDSKLIDEQLLSLMENHPYHDFYEFDSDFFTSSSSISPKSLSSFLLLSRDLNIPIRYKCGFKLRKLGNYKAFGIYFSHTRMLGLDFRDGVESYIHEMAHHIDLNKSFYGRDSMVKALYSYFKPIIKERAEYYLSSEELIARGAEVAVLLHASGYRKYYDLRSEPKKMIAAMRTAFARSRESLVMRDWSVYRGSIHHVNIEAEIAKKNFVLLDKIDEWYSGFWGWDLPTQKNTSRVESTGAGHYRDSPYSKSHYSLNYYMAKAYNLTYGEFAPDRYTDIVTDFLLKEIPSPSILKKQTFFAPCVPDEAGIDIENVNRIKRLYGAFRKFEIKDDYVAAIEPLIDGVVLDKHSIHVVRNDFEKKFSEDPQYGLYANDLEEVIAIASALKSMQRPL